MSKRSQTQKAPCYMILFIQHPEIGKPIGSRSEQWMLKAGGGEKG